jgi:hypothetical protein
VRLWNLSACVLALFVVACGGETVTVEQQNAGTLQLPLTSSSPDGKVYRLVGATFKIVGPQTVTIADTSADTVQTALEAGSYTVELAGTWTMERVDAPGTAVSASLLSPNPLPFSVTKGATSVVRFQFKLPGQGSADVGFQVDTGGWLAGTLRFTDRENPYSGPNAWDALVGKDVPFLMSFESATYSYSGRDLYVQTSPVTVQFGGPHSELLERAAGSMKGGSLFFTLRPYGPGGVLQFGPMIYMGSSPESFRLELGASDPFQGVVDANGAPALKAFQFQTNMVRLLEPYGGEGVRGTASVNGQP